jgi:hypothetical protein
VNFLSVACSHLLGVEAMLRHTSATLDKLPTSPILPALEVSTKTA